MAVTGRCGCGRVRFALNGPLRPVINCHCHRCRRFTGHFMAGTNTAEADLELDDVDGALRWWTPDEEPAVSYGFCSGCGASLFWRAADRPGTVSVAAGTLDPPTGLTTVHALFTAEASDYHRLDPNLPGHPHDRPPGRQSKAMDNDG